MNNIKNPFEFKNDFFEDTFLSYANDLMVMKCNLTEKESIELSEIDKDYECPYSIFGVRWTQYMKDLFDPLFTETKFKTAWFLHNDRIPTSKHWAIDVVEKENQLFQFDLLLFTVLRTSIYVCGCSFQETKLLFDSYLQSFAEGNDKKIQKLIDQDPDIICL